LAFGCFFLVDIAFSRVTVSTVGLVDKIRKLTEELPEVNLAVSLHAPNQKMRTAIVPSAKRFSIEELVDALDNHMMTFISKRKRVVATEENPQNGESTDRFYGEYTTEERIMESTRRRAMIEYVMLDGETSTIEAAHQLGKLCEGRQLVVNLIPYNQTDVKDQLRCPSEEHMQLFRSIVSSYGTFCTIRRTMGADIDSACGQLVNLERKRKNNRDNITEAKDIEDVVTSTFLRGTDTNETNFNKADQLRTTTSKVLPSVHDATTCGAPSVSLEPWIGALAVATTISATCFVASAIFFLHQRRQR
jgi:hypothetical protein